jgi:quinohemoprotein ethanol dehydrogenase
LRWVFHPDTNAGNPRDARIIMGVNRGVAYWNKRVFVALRDGRMVALDADSGHVLWMSRFLHEGDYSASSGAPRVVKGKVLVGNSGAELGARGYLSALDAITGKLAWRFYTVPGKPDQGMDGAVSTAPCPWLRKHGRVDRAVRRTSGAAERYAPIRNAVFSDSR